MAHLQYMPGDPRLVDQIVYELKSKGIFDQFRKDCIADVDTRPAYQNLRQRVESSVSTFLSRQCWQPDLNKNQLREKLRKHILDGNYLEQGVERIVDQVVNPKVASVFIPQVEDLVYNYLGITRKKNVTETSSEKVENLLPTDLEAVSPGSVKSNDGADDKMDIDSSDANETKMEIDEQKVEIKNESNAPVTVNEENGEQVTELSSKKDIDLDSDKTDIPLPSEDIKVENIPSPNDSPPRVDVTKIELPKESPDIPLPDSIIASSDIPLPDEIRKDAKDDYFKPINSDEDESSSDSSLRRNMSPLTPIRNFNNENSCDAQQAFENDLDNSKDKEQKEPSTFRFAIENKLTEETESRIECLKIQKKEIEQMSLSYQFNHQVNINNFNTPLYEDSSNSNNLQIDYESDANSKANLEIKANEEQSLEDSKKDRKVEDKKSSHKSSHRSRDSSKHSSSKDKRSDSKPSSSRDSSRHDKKSSRDDSKSKSSHKERSSDKNDKKDSDKKERDSSKHRSSHKSSSHRDSKSHKSSSSSSSQRRSSSNKHSDDKKSSSSSNHKEKSDKTSERSSDKSSRERSSKDSSSHRSDKDRKSSSSKTSSSKHEEKDKDKKSKKDTDDHYGLSGRGNSTRRSTDRDSNDGSSSSKGSHNPSSTKSSSSQKDSKGHSSKSDNTSPSGESTSPSDKENVLKETKKSDTVAVQSKPIVRIDTRLELPMTSPPRLPFVPDVTLRKPKIAANLEEAKKLMKMRRFLDEEQKRMNQEAALLLEFQANVRPSLSQVYSSIPGPELEFACVVNNEQTPVIQNNPSLGDSVQQNEAILISNPTNALLAVVNAQNIEDIARIDSESSNLNESNYSNELNNESIHKTESPPESEVIKDETTSESEQTSVQTHEDVVEIHDVVEARIPDVGNDIEEIKEVAIIAEDTITVPDVERTADNNISSQELDAEINQETDKDDQDKLTEYFEVTVIAEELSESEETENVEMENFENNNRVIIEVKKDLPLDNNNTVIKKTDDTENSQCIPDEQNLKYFTDSEKYEAELQKERFDKFLKEYTERQCNNRIYLINCDSYEESVVKGVLEPLGSFDVVSYQRNGHLKLPKTKSIVKNVNVASEVSLPFDNNEFEAAANDLEMDLKVTRQTVLSPVKSECSFELSSDYDAKLDEMVNNASRQEIMEIILGNAMSNESPSKMPRIDYVSESNIESEEVTSVKTEANCLKRKLPEVETTVNNNRPVLTPRKLRKMSASDQITSTTEESEPPPTVNVSVPNNTRSKYLGRARRVGLPRPKKPDQPTSPSSDKSVENYEQNTKITPAIPVTPNGKVRPPQRNKIQRYDTSDLYKPKLQYLSRRNNIN